MGGIYELPSGNIEDGENIKEGLVREIKEETNLDTQEIKMFVNSFDYLSSSGKKSRQFNFEVSVKKGEIELTEHDDYKWLKLEDVFKDNSVTDEVKHSVAILKYNKQL